MLNGLEVLVNEVMGEVEEYVPGAIEINPLMTHASWSS